MIGCSVGVKSSVENVVSRLLVGVLGSGVVGQSSEPTHGGVGNVFFVVALVVDGKHVV